MARTQISGRLIEDSSVGRPDVNVTTSGQALITKLIVGSGLDSSQTGVDPGTGDVTISLNTSNLVTSFNSRLGAVTLTGTDVTNALGFTPISGETYLGTVTSIIAGTGLTGGTITSSGTIGLANSGVTAGSYTSANITVDATGRITAASSGGTSSTPNLTQVTTAGSTSTNNITIQRAFPTLFLDHQGSGTLYGGGTIVLKNNLFSSAPLNTRISSIALTDSFSSTKASISFVKDTTDSAIDFASNRFGTSTMRIKDSGNVLIGTTTDSGYKLQVNGDATINGVIAGRGAGNSQYNTVFGFESAINTTTGQYNTSVGNGTLYWNTTGAGNTAFGVYALGGLDGPDNNTGIGQSALGSLWQTGDNNTAVGNAALGWGYDMERCTAVGSFSLINNDANYNTALGYSSGQNNTSGTNNLYLGYMAGYSNQTGSSNVFIGYQAGYNETGSNKLYIANNSTSPLIYGDFATGNVMIGTTTDSGHKLQVNGTVSAQLANSVQSNQVYYNSSTGELSYGAASGGGGSSPTPTTVSISANSNGNILYQSTTSFFIGLFKIDYYAVDTINLDTQEAGSFLGTFSTSAIPETALTSTGVVNIGSGQPLMFYTGVGGGSDLIVYVDNPNSNDYDIKFTITELT